MDCRIIYAIFLLLLTSAGIKAQDDPFYSIVGSSSVKEMNAFKFSTASKNLAAPLSANFTLSGNDVNGNFVTLSQNSVQILNGEVQSFSLDTSSFLAGRYTFFSNIYDPSSRRFVYDQWPLQFVPKVLDVVIHTDKEFYRAKDLIRFRMFAYDEDTRPVVLRRAIVTVFDPNNIAIKNTSNVVFTAGRYSDSLQLSEFITTGRWRIQVQIGAQTFMKAVDVQMYELPLFTATVESPQFVAINDDRFTVKVNVDYTFGKSMQGRAVVRFSKLGTVVYTRTLTLGSEYGFFSVDIENDLKILKTGVDEEVVSIQLVFTDSLSAKVIRAQTQTTIRRLETVLNVIAPRTFKANQVYKFEITATRYDGIPAPANTIIQVTYDLQKSCVRDDGTDYYCKVGTSSASFLTDRFGIAKGQFSVKDWTNVIISVACTLCGGNVFVASLYVPQFDIRVVTQNPVINAAVVVEVETAFDIRSAYCQLQVRNMHFDLFMLNFVNGLARFSFVPSALFIPSTKVSCIGLDAFGQRYETHTSILLEQLPNDVNIELLESVVEPGANSSLLVSGAFKSVVSLLAIDQRLLMLQGNRDPWSAIRNQIIQFSKAQVQGAGSFEFLRLLSNGEAPINTVFSRSEPEEDSIVSTDGSSDFELRRNFDETFLWVDVDLKTRSLEDKTRGVETVVFETPDSITSFFISGVGFHSTIGAGIPNAPGKLETFKEFFLVMDLPYSIKQTETLMQTFSVFNYMDVEQTVVITVNRDDKYTIVDTQTRWQILSTTYSQSFVSKPNSIQSFTIGIKPLRSGVIPITLMARGTFAGDALEKALLVTPEGVERTLTSTVFLFKIGKYMENVQLTCDVPASTDPSTSTATLTIVGDLLGDALANLDNQIWLPTGCGEQITSRFAVNSMIYNFYKASGKDLTETVQRVAQLNAQGLQNLLRLRLSDGSFKYFASHTSGSTWLTAYVIKTLRQSREIINVDPSLINSALEFIISKQAADGAFIENPSYIYYRYHSGLFGKVGVTAYIAILLSELLDEYPQYRDARDRAVQYAATNVVNSNTYELAITCNAMYLSSHPSFNAKYNTLLSLAVETSEKLYWDIGSLSVQVETASYVLLFVNKFDSVRSIKLARFIISHKYIRGGWYSSQDTAMALESLASVAALVTVYDGKVDILAWPDQGDSVSTFIDSTNQRVQQTFTLDPKTRLVDMIARGPTSGKAIISLTCTYFEKLDNIPPRFAVNYQINGNCNKPLSIDICINYVPIGDDNRSNMAIMMMSMPSGYVFDPETPGSADIQRLEVENANTKVVAYFNSMTSTPICFKVNAIQTSVVADLGSSLIEMHDYYNPEKKAEVFYNLPKVWSC